MNRLESLMSGGIKLLRDAWDTIHQERGWNADDEHLLFGCEMFGEQAQYLRSTMLVIVRQECKQKIDLYSLRHHYATARVVQLTKDHSQRLADLRKRSASLPTASEIEIRRFNLDASSLSAGLVELLHEMGQSNTYSLAGHYFHEMGYLRKQFIK